MRCHLSWGKFLQQLRDVEKLVVRVYNREQFVALCVHDEDDAALFKTWTASLRGLKWEVLVKFLSEAAW